MSAKVWCRMGNGTEHEELHPTEEAANQSLTRTLETHRKKGHRVSEKSLEREPRPQYTGTDNDGCLTPCIRLLIRTIPRASKRQYARLVIAQLPACRCSS